jgi:hypothetical protein
VGIPTEVYTGNGTNYVVGGNGGNLMVAGNGNNTFLGGNGDDVMVAGLTGNDVFDPDYSQTGGNDTYIVPGLGSWDEAVYEWRIVHRADGSTVQVREDNKGCDQLLYNGTVNASGQFVNYTTDHMGDDGFWSDLGSILERVGPTVLLGALTGGLAAWAFDIGTPGWGVITGAAGSALYAYENGGIGIWVGVPLGGGTGQAAGTLPSDLIELTMTGSISYPNTWYAGQGGTGSTPGWANPFPDPNQLLLAFVGASAAGGAAVATVWIAGPALYASGYSLAIRGGMFYLSDQGKTIVGYITGWFGSDGSAPTTMWGWVQWTLPYLTSSGGK